MNEKRLEEFILKAVQSGKQETSGLAHDLKGEMRLIKEMVTRLDTGVDGINARLDRLNSKVATHVIQISELQKTDALNQPKIDKLDKQYNDSTIEMRALIKKWAERVVWIIILIIGVLLVKSDLVSQDLIDLL